MSEIRSPEAEASASVPHKSPSTKPTILLPQAEAALKRYDEELVKDKVHAERSPAEKGHLRNILYALFEKQLEGFSIETVENENGRVEMPITRLNVTALAKELYSAKHILPQPAIPTKPTEEHPKEIKYFVIPGFLNEGNGQPFAFDEMVMDQGLKYLLRNINAIKRGEKPDQIDVYVLGSPTSWWGKSSDKLLENLKKNGTKTLGEEYAELIKRTLPKDTQEEEKNVSVVLYGDSQGATLAIEAGKILALQGVVQAERGINQKKLPNLFINVVNAVGLHRLSKGPQMRLGFGAEIAYQFFFNKIAITPGLQEKGFLKDLNEILKKRGITRDENPDQLKLKDRIRLVFRKESIRGQPKDIPIPVRILTGTRDPVQFSLGRFIEAQKKRKSNANGFVFFKDKKHPNIHEHAITMSHVFPYLRRNVITKWTHQANRIYKILE